MTVRLDLSLLRWVPTVESSCSGAFQLMDLWLYLMICRSLKKAVPNLLPLSQQVLMTM
uniref:Uncharacterized protein n=1 Tax=Rhizophora mucronata TaxID=61149 RepID=A0A2P2JT26_RHIMU